MMREKKARYWPAGAVEEIRDTLGQPSPRMQGDGCQHPRAKRQFFRLTMANGLRHYVERCTDCGANARGVGTRVKASELHQRHINPAQLQEDPWKDSEAARRDNQQGSLFGGRPEGSR